MAHSVIITTPIPTWEKTVARYGLSKADQEFVIRLVERKTSRSSVVDARRNRRSKGLEMIAAEPKASRTVAMKVGSSVGKKTTRARANA
jgi:hypothetical protein